MTTLAQGKIVSPSLTSIRINRSFALFALLIAITFLIRITDINYNGIFIDEAIYVTVGEDALVSNFSQHATTWMYGSYLYPMIAATVNNIGGLESVRILSAILTTITVVFVFLGTFRLFGWGAGLWTSLLFSLSGTSINLGQFAVYDVPGILFLSIAYYCIVTASLKSRRKQNHYFFLASLFFILAALFKYSFVLYLPALILTGFTICILQRQPILPLLTFLVMPIVFVLGLYIFCYWSDLTVLFTSDGGITKSESLLIVQAILQEFGVVILLAAIGGFLLLRLTYNDPRFESIRACFLFAILVTCLVLFVLAGPVFHFLTSNSRALEKHSLYSLIFLCPAVGYTVEAIVQKKHVLRGHRANIYSVIGVAITFIGLVWFVNSALDRNWGFQNSWPDLRKTVEYLRQQGLSKESQVLAEGSAIYEYYFDFGLEDRAVWNNTWSLQYGNQQGIEAMVVAIQDHYFDFVILDDYFTPEKTLLLETALGRAGYRLTYRQAPQMLSTGRNISVRVYRLPRVNHEYKSEVPAGFVRYHITRLNQLSAAQKF